MALGFGDGAVTREHRHFAEHVAHFQRAHDDAPTGVVGHRNLAVAVDQRADETSLLAALDDGFIPLEGAQFGTIDNGLDAVRGEAFEQRHLLEQKGNQFVTGHDGFLPGIGILANYYIAALHKY